MPPLLGSWAVDITTMLALAVILAWMLWRAMPRTCGAVWGRCSRYPGEAVVCDRLPDHDGMHLDTANQIWWD